MDGKDSSSTLPSAPVSPFSTPCPVSSTSPGFWSHPRKGAFTLVHPGVWEVRFGTEDGRREPRPGPSTRLTVSPSVVHTEGLGPQGPTGESELVPVTGVTRVLGLGRTDSTPVRIGDRVRVWDLRSGTLPRRGGGGPVPTPRDRVEVGGHTVLGRDYRRGGILGKGAEEGVKERYKTGQRKTEGGTGTQDETGNSRTDTHRGQEGRDPGEGVRNSQTETRRRETE